MELIGDVVKYPSKKVIKKYVEDTDRFYWGGLDPLTITNHIVQEVDIVVDKLSSGKAYYHEYVDCQHDEYICVFLENWIEELEDFEFFDQNGRVAIVSNI